VPANFNTAKAIAAITDKIVPVVALLIDGKRVALRINKSDGAIAAGPTTVRGLAHTKETRLNDTETIAAIATAHVAVIALFAAFDQTVTAFLTYAWASSTAPIFLHDTQQTTTVVDSKVAVVTCLMSQDQSVATDCPTQRRNAEARPACFNKA
jgi:hypothetical protein